VADAMGVMTAIQKSEEDRLTNFAILNEKLKRTEEELRRWRSIMNFRVRIQFLFFPIIMFAVASVVAIAKLLLRQLG
jgi:hypothetical protein